MKIAIRNFMSVTGMRVFTAALSFLFFVFLARHWDSTRLGAYTTLFALSLLLQQISLLGLHIPVARDMVQRPHDLQRLGSSIAVIGLVVGALIGIALGLAGSLAYPEDMHAALWLVGASFVPTALVGVSDTILLAQERLHVTAAVNMVEAVVRTLLSMLLVTTGHGLTALFVAYLGCRILSVIGYLWFGHVARELRPGAFSIATLRPLLRLVPAFAGIVILQSGFTRVDFVILSKLGSLAQVGLYSAPYKLFEAALTIPAIAAMVLFPTLARWFAASPTRFERLTREVVRVVLTVGLPIAITVAFEARTVIVALFGESFVAAAPVLMWLAVVPVISAVDIIFGGVLHSSHHQASDVRAMFAAFIFYVGALCALIPLFGFVGAAVATAAAEVVQTLLRYRVIRRLLPFASMWGTAAGPVAAAVVMLGVALLLRTVSPLVSLPAALAAHAVTIAALRVVTLADVHTLRRALITDGQGA
jgi:O-antigen/teichoic acid export membrane protein